MGGNQSHESAEQSKINLKEKEHDHHHFHLNFDIAHKLFVRLRGEKNKHDEDVTLSQEHFQSTFPECLRRFAELLFCHWLLDQKSDRGALTKQQFAKVASDIQHMTEASQTLYYFHVFAQGKPLISKAHAEELIQVCLMMTLSSSTLPLCIHDSSIITSMTTSLFGTNTSIDYETFSSWIDHNAPRLFSGVQSWLYTMFSQVSLPMEIIVKHDEGSTQSHILSHIVSKSGLLTIEILWSLSVCLPTVFFDVAETKSHTQHSLATSKSWTSLYNSNEDGMSVNRFSHHVCSYKGPTVMIVSCASDQLFCVAADTEWRDGHERFGGNACRAIQLKPVFRVLESGSGILLWNKSGRSRQIPHGIQVGSNPKAIPLFISHDFETLSNYGTEYQLNAIEVWGCGSSVAKQAQLKQKDWERREVQKAQQQKLRVEPNWRDSPDRVMLQWAGINTDHDENSSKEGPETLFK